VTGQRSRLFHVKQPQTLLAARRDRTFTGGSTTDG
jgi:hypothetical protein